MGTQYQVTIALNPSTVSALSSEGYQLQVFKGVKGNNKAALPTVWFNVSQFSGSVNLAWTEDYGGYVDNQILQDGVTVNISSQQQMELGDTMTLQSSGNTSVSTNGRAGAIGITSQQTTEWLCGMTQSMNGSHPTPVCAFPLHGQSAVLMEPYETVVLMFATSQVDTGTVVEEAVSASVTILLSGTQTQVAVNYDINAGWSPATSGDPNVQINVPNTDLAPILIVPALS